MIKERLKGAMLIYDADAEGNTGTRNLGLIVARGTLLVLISPVDGSEEIPNPFLQADDEGQE
jgi:U6 snRNA-associated Sm-like protein LSm7